jgi:transposase InsO family protein
LKRLDRIFTNHPVYGSRRLQVTLLREGISIGRRRVRRLMRKLGLWAVRPKRNTSKRHPEHKIYTQPPTASNRGGALPSSFAALGWRTPHEAYLGHSTTVTALAA